MSAVGLLGVDDIADLLGHEGNQEARRKYAGRFMDRHGLTLPRKPGEHRRTNQTLLRAKFAEIWADGIASGRLQ